MPPAPPDYTPDAAAIERGALWLAAVGAGLGALWLGLRRVHRFVGRAAFRRELALVAKVPQLEDDVSSLKEIAESVRTLIEGNRRTEETIRVLSDDVAAMRQEHADGMSEMREKFEGLAREVSEIRGEMKGRDAVYDRRRTP